MELEQLRCPVAAAEGLHSGRAAQRLSTLRSTLGRQIQALERDLVAQLLARTTRSVTLTGNGALLPGVARVLLAQASTPSPCPTSSPEASLGRCATPASTMMRAETSSLLRCCSKAEVAGLPLAEEPTRVMNGASQMAGNGGKTRTTRSKGGEDGVSGPAGAAMAGAALPRMAGPAGMSFKAGNQAAKIKRPDRAQRQASREASPSRLEDALWHLAFHATNQMTQVRAAAQRHGTYIGHHPHHLHRSG